MIVKRRCPNWGYTNNLRPSGPDALLQTILRKVNKLQAQQQLEAQAQVGVTERSGERGPV